MAQVWKIHDPYIMRLPERSGRIHDPGGGVDQGGCFSPDWWRRVVVGCQQGIVRCCAVGVRRQHRRRA